MSVSSSVRFIWSRRALRYLTVIALILFVLAILYALFAHDLIRSAYAASTAGHKTFAFIDHSRHDLPYYLARADLIFWQYLFFGIPLTILFWYGLWRVSKWLLAQSSTGVERPDSAASFRYDWLAALSAYCVLTAIYFFPTLGTINSALIGPPEDNLAGYWSLWWANDQMLHGSQALTFSNWIYFPEGSTLYYFAWSFYNLLFTFLMRLLFDGVAVFNLVMLHGYPLAGLGAFLLVKRVTGNSIAALVGGFLFAFNPNHFQHSQHHIHINSIQFIPFFVLAFWDAIRLRTTSSLALAAAFFLLNALCDWTYMIMAGYFVVLAYIYLAVRNQRWWLGEFVRRSVVIVGATALLLSPWLVPMVKIALSTPETDVGGRNTYVVDFAGLAVPGLAHPLGDWEPIQAANASYTGNHHEAAAYLGIAALLLVLFAGKQIFRVAARWWLGFIAFAALALGPQLHLLGKSLPIGLPYTVIAYIPFLANLRAPARFIVYVYLFWAVIVAVALSMHWRRLSGSSKGRLLLVALVVLLGADYFSICRSTTPVASPSILMPRADEPAPRAYMNLPNDYVPTMYYMMQQTIHGIPIIEGAATRKIGRSLIDRLDFADLDRQQKQLDSAGVTHIAIHKNLLPDTATTAAYYRAKYATLREDDSCLVLLVKGPQ